MNTYQLANGVPYLGPRWFGVEDSRLFFGRRTECFDIASRVLAGYPVIVHGVSGAGKSSILHGGVIAQICKEMWSMRIKRNVIVIAVREWLVPDLHQVVEYRLLQPEVMGDDAAGFLSESSSRSCSYGSEHSGALLDACSEALGMAAKEFGDPSPDQLAPLVLFVLDQIEDLWSQTSGAVLVQQMLAKRQLAAIIRRTKAGSRPEREFATVNNDEQSEFLSDPLQLPGLRFGIVGGIRSDCLGFLDRLNDDVSLGFDDLFELGLLSAEAAKEAICGPVRGQPHCLPEGEIDQLVAELGKLEFGQNHSNSPESAVSPKTLRIEPLILSIVMQSLYRNYEEQKNIVGKMHYPGPGAAKEIVEKFFEESIGAVPQKLATLRDYCFSMLVTRQGRSIGKTAVEIYEDIGAWTLFSTEKVSARGNLQDVINILNVLAGKRILRMVVTPFHEDSGQQSGSTSRAMVRFELYHNLFSLLASQRRERLILRLNTEARSKKLLSSLIFAICLVLLVAVAASSYFMIGSAQDETDKATYAAKQAEIFANDASAAATAARKNAEELKEKADDAQKAADDANAAAKAERGVNDILMAEQKNSAVFDFVKLLPNKDSYRQHGTVQKLKDADATLSQFEERLKINQKNDVNSIVYFDGDDQDVSPDLFTVDVREYPPALNGLRRCTFELTFNPSHWPEFRLGKLGEELVHVNVAWDLNGHHREPLLSPPGKSDVPISDKNFIGPTCHTSVYAFVGPLDAARPAVFKVDMCQLAQKRFNGSTVAKGCSLTGSYTDKQYNRPPIGM